MTKYLTSWTSWKSLSRCFSFIWISGERHLPLFQYELFPYLDNGDFLDCTKLMAYYQKSLYDKEAWLSPVRKSELLLYTALVHIGNQNYKAAKKYISNAIIDHNIKYQPLMRTIRLVPYSLLWNVVEIWVCISWITFYHQPFFSQRAYFQNGAYHSVVSEPAASSSFEKRSRSFFGRNFFLKCRLCMMINMRISYCIFVTLLCG